MTLDRLTTILDAYGADPARWPSPERADALALVARSADARARLDAAARLDDVLDSLPPTPPPSRALHARLAAAAPARSPAPRVAMLLAPLAAAAVLALWLVRTPGPVPGPRADVPMARLGVYETPTDSLLTLDDLDVAGGVPALRCPESGLGCPDIGVDSDPALTRDSGRMRA